MSDQRQADYDAIMATRAEKLAAAHRSQELASVVVEVALVGIGPELLGIPAQRLRELVVMPAIASLPGLPPWLKGIVQIRGELVCVLDLAQWLGIHGERRCDYLAVVEGAAGAIGIAVERLLGFRGIARHELAEGMQAADGGKRPVEAMTTDLLSILDVDAILGDPRLVVA